MAADEEREGVAAEFALGTLTAPERSDVEHAMVEDQDLARLVEAWERCLSPLALALEPVAVPGHLRAKVLAAVAGSLTPDLTLLRRRLVRWRSVAVASMALAAALGVVAILGISGTLPFAAKGRFVAVLQSEGPGPAFLASVDLARGTITVRSVTAQTPVGKSYELWALGAGRDKPQSLGVISADYRVPSNRLGKLDSQTLGETTFAVSLEPEGGSPTGQPTGPVVFTGALVATE